jgi:DNA mismatch endonuclease (patch repair protein)
MVDKLTPKKRSENMRKIRSKDTKPEMIVRRLVHGMGYRYRLHGKLPGKPDLVFSKKKKAIFVHGCFWHQHNDKNCKITRVPKSNLDFWIPKLEKTKKRDAENQSRLEDLGWKFLVIWECQISNAETLSKRLKKFLDS